MKSIAAVDPTSPFALPPDHPFSEEREGFPHCCYGDCDHSVGDYGAERCTLLDEALETVHARAKKCPPEFCPLRDGK